MASQLYDHSTTVEEAASIMLHLKTDGDRRRDLWRRQQIKKEQNKGKRTCSVCKQFVNHDKRNCPMK